MAVDIFLELKGVKGEAQDAKFKGLNAIDILAFSYGASNSGTTHMGAGGGGGKVNVQDMDFTKYVDSSSPVLMEKCYTGDHIAEGTLTVRKSGGKEPLEYMVYKLTDIMVVAHSGGGSGGEDRLTENVTLNFSEIEFIYTPQEPSGAKGSPIPYSYDIAGNAPS